MGRIRGRDTTPEKLVRSMVHKLGFRFRLHTKGMSGTPDLVFPGRRCVIFVHGCFWHAHDCGHGRLPTSNVAFWRQKFARNQKRDSRVQRQLESDGWKVLTVWECETRKPGPLQRRLTRFLNARQNAKNRH